MYFRKTFSVPSKSCKSSDIKSARLYITALGVYEAEINGETIGDEVLAPGFSSYHNRHLYNTFDVTENIHGALNAIGVLVGEGWYAGNLFPLADQPYDVYYGYSIGPLALLRITMQNGTIITVPTDTTWKTSKGALIDAKIYNGSEYDSTKELKNWSRPRFNDTAWKAALELPSIAQQLATPDGPPIRRLKEFEPRDVFKSPSGKTIVDFGQNFAGWVRLTVHGDRGTRITLRHAEVLENGELSIRPLRSAKATDSFVLHGKGVQILEPHFTYHGFRYVEVDGWPSGTTLDATSIAGVAIWSDMEETGWFNCSNSDLNQLHQNVRWSMRSNFLSIPTDCPQRDKGMGWTGDAHVFGPTANYLYNTAGFWSGWHKDLWAEMQFNGSMITPRWVPFTPPGVQDSQPTALWGDVAVGGPWNLWRSFGDKDMLVDQYSQARAWLDKGVVRNESGLWDRSTFQYGDWLDPATPPDNPSDAATSPHLVADAYLVRMTEIMTNMSSALEKVTDGEKYSSQAEELRDAFRKAWIVDDSMANETQAAYVLGVMFDLFEDNQEQAAANTLVNLIRDNDHLIGTGFAATYLIGHALSKIGAEDDFYQMLLQKKAPSWLYQVAMGATTIWERRDSLLPDGSVNPGDMTSFNHYAIGAVAEWMHTRIGGLAPVSPGWKDVSIAPVPGGGLTSANAEYVSGYGLVSSSWTLYEGKFKLEIKIPPNSRGVVTLPFTGKVHNVGSGSYSFYDEEL